MSNVSLTYAGWDYDRTKAIFDGEVRAEGCSLVPVKMRTEEIFRRSLHREEFDITELSASSYIMQRAKGNEAFIAIPVFVSRAYRHRCIYVRSDRGIRSPKDLEGKKLGVPEYQTTVALWMRGILQDEYGVDFKSIHYITGGVNEPGRKERLPLALPADIKATPIKDGECLSQLLEDGEIDAVIAPNPPTCFVTTEGIVERMFPDYVAEEANYFKRTGFFPIMHLIAIRRDNHERYPWLAESLFKAFAEAKVKAYKNLREAARKPANQFLLPWLLPELERTEALMGPDFWQYGFEANRKELETMFRYSVEQYLAPKSLDVASLFAERTLALKDISSVSV